jgi:hypothetical protein
VLEPALPDFLAKLRRGLDLHGDQYSPAPAEPAEPGDVVDDPDHPRDRPVRLKLRAVPLIDMIETAIRQKSDLLWEHP